MAVTAAMSIDVPTRGSRLTLRTSHTTINGGRVVVVRSFPDTIAEGTGKASSLPSSVQHP
jgi:hypothetical protein